MSITRPGNEYFARLWFMWSEIPSDEVWPEEYLNFIENEIETALSPARNGMIPEIRVNNSEWKDGAVNIDISVVFNVRYGWRNSPLDVPQIELYRVDLGFESLELAVAIKDKTDGSTVWLGTTDELFTPEYRYSVYDSG